jgi:hypothetical protein
MSEPEVAMRNGRFVVAVLGVSAALTACGGENETAGRTPVTAPPAITDDDRATGARAFESLAPDWKTDFRKSVVPASEFRSGGPGKDGIPAIDEPQFVSVAEATNLTDRDPVLAIDLNGEARAYPLQILIWHEIVNDTVAGEPIAVTYCPLCNSSLVFKRTVEGAVLDFGVSGFLRNSDLVMFDRQTESWWQQVTGEALVGAYSGTVLDVVPASTIAFSEFKDSHPDGLVLSRETGHNRDYGRSPYGGYDAAGSDPFLFDGVVDERLDAVDRVVAVEIGDDVAAYAFSRLADEPAVNDTVGGVPIVVLYRPGVASPLDRSSIPESRDVGQGVAFERTLDRRVLTFEADGGLFRDLETGSTWSITGRATSGPLAGSQLELVVHGNHFWFAWAVFKPETRVWQAKAGR